MGDTIGTRFAAIPGVRPRTFSILAILWLLALSAYEIYHFVQGVPWPGYTPVVNYISFFWVAIFLTGCVWLARYQMSRPIVPFIAFTGAFIHGVAIRVGSGWQGYYLIPSGLILLVLGISTLKYRAIRVPDRRYREIHRAA